MRGRFPCDCCGHWTMAAAPDGESLQLCAVCGWEDSEYWRGGELGLELFAAQQAFVDGGVAVPLLRDQVRAPTAEELRDPRWQPYDGRGQSLLARVQATFANVRLPKGVSPTEAIHQSQLTDNYGADYGPPPTPGVWHPVGVHGWHNVTFAGVRALFCGIGGLNFMDEVERRFFVPAVARWYLEDTLAKPDQGPWLPLFHFTSIGERQARAFAGYQPHQQQWLAELFAFATRPGSASSRRTVRARPERAAWRDTWRARLPPDYVNVYGDA